MKVPLSNQAIDNFIDAKAAQPVTALTLPQRASVALGSAAHELKLHELVANSAGILTVTNKAGRDECHTAYMVLKNTRIGITNMVDGATEDAKAFTKAVKAEALRLLAITEKEESRLQELRDGFDEAEKAEKAAKIAAERVRTEGIQKMIDNLRDYPRMILASDPAVLSVALKAAIDEFDGWVPHEDDYAEFVPVAAATIEESLTTMRTMFDAAAAKEAAAAQAQAERDAEAAKIIADREELAQLQAAAAIKAAAERDELDRQRADLAETARLAKVEADRIANEQAIERRRLADQAAEQEVIAKAARDQAAAVLQLAADALAEREAQFQREKDDHAEEMRLAAEALLPRAPEPVAPPVEPEPAPEPEVIAAPVVVDPVLPQRPRDTEIILAVANEFGVSPATAHEWILAVTAQ